MTFRLGASCACYVGVFYFLYLINIGNTQLLINVKNQVKYNALDCHLGLVYCVGDKLKMRFHIRKVYEIGK